MFLAEEERIQEATSGIDISFSLFYRYPIPKYDDIYCNSSDFNDKQIKIIWPFSCDSNYSKDRGMCKPTIFRSLSTIDYMKVVIGDSITDLAIAKLAELVIARDFLLQKCKEQSLFL